MRTAIILAGGFGTRLQSEVSDVPKPMAPISGSPFLEYLLAKLNKEGFEEVILAVGHLNEKIINYFGDCYQNISIQYSVEESPLGTGGAISKAIKKISRDCALVLNGDTYVNLDYASFYDQSVKSNTPMTMCGLYQEKADRYGTLSLDEDGSLIGFEEKKQGSSGYINSGVYCINKDWLIRKTPETKYSFETEILQNDSLFDDFGIVRESCFFIDIGIPNDYKYLDLLCIVQNEEWTLFLDRDGTINVRIEDDYVRDWSQFEWLPDADIALAKLSNIFQKTIVVTNQQGVGKGLMSREDVEAIHDRMSKEVEYKNGKINALYYCPELKSKRNNCRKPNESMGHWAQSDFPSIDFKKSIMIGDMPSDIEFGHGLNMMTIGIGEFANGAHFNKKSLCSFVFDLENAPKLNIKNS